MNKYLFTGVLLFGAFATAPAMAEIRNGFVVCDHPEPTGCEYHGKLESYTQFADDKLRFLGVMVTNMHYSFAQKKMVIYVQYRWGS